MSKRSVKALLKKARPRTEPFRVFLDMGDGAVDAYDVLVDEFDGLDEDDPRRDELRGQVSDALAKLSDGHEVEGRLGMLPALAWESLKGDHPAREGNEIDAMFGVNVQTCFPAAVKACLVEPEMDDEDWTVFESVVNLGDWQRLGAQCFALNERAVAVPKLPKDFLRTTKPDSASKPPKPGD